MPVIRQQIGHGQTPGSTSGSPRYPRFHSEWAKLVPANCRFAQTIFQKAAKARVVRHVLTFATAPA